MTFEEFSRGDSLLHSLDPRVKITGTLALTLVVALCHSFCTGVAALLVGGLLLTLSRLHYREVFRRLFVVNGFIAFLWLTLPFTYPGESVAVSFLHLSRPGIELAALITLKANSIVLFFITLLATSTVAELGHGLAELGLPAKLCLLLLFTYRYIFVIHQEYQRLARAAKMRCFRPGTNLHSYRTYAHLFGMTLVKSWNRAERVSQAMILRGFQGRFYRLQEQVMDTKDLFFLGMLLAITLGLIMIEIRC